MYLFHEVTSTTVEELFEDISLSACPGSYRLYYDANGNTLCCDGEIMANKCMGGHFCTLHGSSDAPNCADVILADYKAKGQSQCPASMANYFEDKPNQKKGCTTSVLNASLTGPKHTSQGQCVIYDTAEKNRAAMDSCDNQKQMEDYPCFGDHCTKSLVQPIADKPVLIAISFTDSNGIHRTSYTKASMEAQLDSTRPNWRNQGIDLSKNIQVTEVAKAVYVDKTMAASEIQV